MATYNEARDGLCIRNVEDLPVGTMFRKLRCQCGACLGKGEVAIGEQCVRCSGLGTLAHDAVLVRGQYDRPNLADGYRGGYTFDHWDDINRVSRPLPKGTRVLVGFSF